MDQDIAEKLFHFLNNEAYPDGLTERKNKQDNIHGRLDSQEKNLRKPTRKL